MTRLLFPSWRIIFACAGLLLNRTAAPTSLTDRTIECGETCVAYEVSPFGHDRSATCRGSVTTSGRDDIAIIEGELCPATSDVLAVEPAFCFSEAPSQISNPKCSFGSISMEDLSVANFTGRDRACDAAATGCRHKFALEVPFLSLGDYGFQTRKLNGSNSLVSTNQLHLCTFFEAAGSLADWAVICMQSFFLTFTFQVEQGVLMFSQWRISSSVYLTTMDSWIGEAAITDVSDRAATWPARVEDCTIDSSKSSVTASQQRIPPFDRNHISYFSLAGPALDGQVNGTVWLRCTSSTYDDSLGGYVTGSDVLFAFPVALTGTTPVTGATHILWTLQLTTSDGVEVDPSYYLVGSEQVFQRLSVGGASAAAATCTLEALDVTHADRGGSRVTRQVYAMSSGITPHGVAMGLELDNDDGSCDFTYSVRPGAFAFYGGEVVWEAQVEVVPTGGLSARSVGMQRAAHTQNLVVTSRINIDGEISVDARPRLVKSFAAPPPPPSSSNTMPLWVWLANGAGAVMLIALVAAVLARRRRSHGVSSTSSGDVEAPQGRGTVATAPEPLAPAPPRSAFEVPHLVSPARLECLQPIDMKLKPEPAFPDHPLPNVPVG